MTSWTRRPTSDGAVRVNEVHTPGRLMLLTIQRERGHGFLWNLRALLIILGSVRGLMTTMVHEMPSIGSSRPNYASPTVGSSLRRDVLAHPSLRRDTKTRPGVKWPETCMNTPLQVRRVGCVVYKIRGFAKAKTGVAFAQLFDRGYS